MTTTGDGRGPSDEGEPATERANGPDADAAATGDQDRDLEDGDPQEAERREPAEGSRGEQPAEPGAFAPSARYEAGRPTRPPVLPARVAPKLRPPDPPDPLIWSATAWRVVALSLGLAVGLVFLDVMNRKTVVRQMLEERAPDLRTEDIDRATNILFFGSLAVWGALAILVLFVARGMKRPVLRPRFLGVLLLVVILGVLAFTAFPLTGSGGLGLAARASLGVAALATLVAGLLGLAPGTWRWVREHRGESAPRRPTAAPPGPPPPPPDR